MMLDQSFSVENFRRIFDLQNRRGVYLETDFFPEVAEVTSDLKDCKHEKNTLREKKNNIPIQRYLAIKQELDDKKKSLFQKKENLLTEELLIVSKQVNSDGFRFPLTSFQLRSGKSVYRFNHEPCSYFASKQVQHNLRKLYRLKQGNRNEIIPQLKKILGDTFPKVVIKTDIKGFYENIPTVKLVNMLNEQPLLTLSSKKIIRQILRDFHQLAYTDKGIPRGIGISAYLSELYMKRFDEAIREHKYIQYYTRYIDDIVAVFGLNPAQENGDYLGFIKQQLDELGLEVNEDKTDVIMLNEPAIKEMNYLGYNFKFGNAETKLDITSTRFNRYKKRIDLVFDDYETRRVRNEKVARKLLVKRLRFLTGNTRLLNNKKNALVGIYFSNNHLNNYSNLTSLDDYLAQKITGLGCCELRERLSVFSFLDGFKFKRFSPYSLKDLEQIVSVWHRG